MAQQPVPWSWPSVRHAAARAGSADAAAADEQLAHASARAGSADAAAADEQLAHADVARWLRALTVADDGQLLVSSDSLHLLPPQLPYELLGPLLLAAVHNAQQQRQQQQQQQQQRQQQQQHPQQLQGLHLYGIDLQEPLSAPLTTCLSAAFCLQQLSLQELNIDQAMARALGGIVASGSSCLSVLSLQTVFMCELAWAAFCSAGLAHHSCGLRTLRLQDCLTPASLALLAAAIPAGCPQLEELDVSQQPAASSSGCCSGGRGSGSGSSTCDAAWAGLFQALAQPDACCRQLQVLRAARCPLGPAAAAALVQLLCSSGGLHELVVAGCSEMGQEALRQLMAAARGCPQLQRLDASCTGLADDGLAGLLQGSRAWHGLLMSAPRPHLQHLQLGGNPRITGAAAEQLAKALAGSLRSLQLLSLQQCPGVGDQGAAALAAALATGCAIVQLDLSGCEIADAGAAALAELVSGTHPSAAAAAAAAAGGAGLRELRLADNLITPAGVSALARAVSGPCCTLQLLDLSFNSCGPGPALQPLVLAAALAAHTAAAAPAGQQQRAGITVLRECSLEWCRVEASRAAAAAAAADAPPTSPPAAATSSCLGACSRGAAVSACSSANTCGAADAESAGAVDCHSPAGSGAGRPQSGSAQSVWLFNGLFEELQRQRGAPAVRATAAGSGIGSRSGRSRSASRKHGSGSGTAEQAGTAGGAAAAAASGGSSGGGSIQSSSSFRTVHPDLLASNNSTSSVGAHTGRLQRPPAAQAAPQAAAARRHPSGSSVCGSSVCGSSSSGSESDCSSTARASSRCFMAEASFSFQAAAGTDAAARAAGGCDQAPGWGQADFSLSPPNPLFQLSSASASPGSPCDPLLAGLAQPALHSSAQESPPAAAAAVGSPAHHAAGGAGLRPPSRNAAAAPKDRPCSKAHVRLHEALAASEDQRGSGTTAAAGQDALRSAASPTSPAGQAAAAPQLRVPSAPPARQAPGAGPPASPRRRLRHAGRIQGTPLSARQRVGGSCSPHAGGGKGSVQPGPGGIEIRATASSVQWAAALEASGDDGAPLAAASQRPPDLALPAIE